MAKREIPRITLSQGKQLYADLLRTPVVGPEHKNYFCQSGFEEFEKKLVSILRTCGYPKPFKREFAPIDQEIACLFRDEFSLTAKDAVDMGLWRGLNCKVFPWLVQWRWTQNGLPNPQRFLDRSRNYIGNLWWRAELFSECQEDGTRVMLRGLLEDDFIGILERPAIRGYREGLHILAANISKYRATHGTSRANDVVRRVIMNFRIYASAHEFFALSVSEIERTVARLFLEAHDREGL